MTTGNGDMLSRHSVQNLRVIPNSIHIIKELELRLVTAVGWLVILVHILKRTVIHHRQGQLMGRSGLDALETGRSI